MPMSYIRGRRRFIANMKDAAVIAGHVLLAIALLITFYLLLAMGCITLNEVCQ